MMYLRLREEPGQAVCDHQGHFIDTYVGCPGSVHDSRVLHYSPLYRSSLYPPPGHFILGGTGTLRLQHPLLLITPYKRPIQGVGAQRFNSHHFRARSIIECAFAMMKTRFRAIFLQALEVHHTFVPHVITTCAILHNICLVAGDIVAPEDEPEEDEAEDEGENGLETVVLPCVTSCLQRCLPWRRCPLTTNIFNSEMAAID
ncbi:putative nuclease HARBI1 isoform X2 [Micropterus dolomieu]|uniref:putative nuclease HARBI1 isoform X2 n=1 Tax=Micropterus dolomieu TaxID=147949 RepID=UPI001E8DE4E1|nr:putative nuclease HARBI1 isoform X2 [Micropterus dolomieu]